jgi:DnaJ-class molecular chaperone
MEKMMMKKKTKKSASKTKSAKTASRKGMRGGSVPGSGPRKCGICKGRGHNRRSHEPGGKMAMTSGSNAGSSKRRS